MASVALLWPWARTTPGKEWGSWWGWGGGIAGPSKRWSYEALLGEVE